MHHDGPVEDARNATGYGRPRAAPSVPESTVINHQLPVLLPSLHGQPSPRR